MSSVRFRNRAIFVLVLLVALLSLGGCDFVNKIFGAALGEASLTVGQSAVAVSVGKTKTVSVVALNASGTAETFTANVDDSSIAQVTTSMNSVTLTGVYQGTALVTIVSVSGQMKTISVTVTPAGSGGSSTTPEADSSLATLTCNGTAVTLSAGVFTYPITVAAGVANAAIVATPTQASLAHVQVNQTAGTTGSMTLYEGLNTAIIVVTSKDSSSTSVYQLQITKLAATNKDATLSSLSLSGLSLADFAPGTEAYTIAAPAGTASTVVTATPNASGATVAFNGTAGSLAGGTYTSSAIPLAAGATTTIFVSVASQDGSSSKTYQVSVAVAAAASSDTTLKRLAGTDLPFTFSASTYNYNVSVPNTAASTTITAIANQANATVLIAGPSGSAATQALTVGLNSVTVRVTAPDGTIGQAYTLKITRAAAASSDASLSSLSASGLTFGFASGVFAYTAAVPNTTASTTISAIASQATAVVSINGPSGAAATQSLYEGSNVITVSVTAPDGTAGTPYVLTVVRAATASTDASLSGLAASGIPLDFSPAVDRYDVAVPNATASTTISPIAAQPTATIAVSGPSGSSKTQALAVGPNTIEIIVTAPDGATRKTYTIAVTRAAPASNDTSLSSLSGTNLNFGFNSGTRGYSMTVANAVASTTISAVASQPTATVAISGPSGATATQALAVGSNTITVTVTAPDSTVGTPYTLTITRQSPAPYVSAFYPPNGSVNISPVYPSIQAQFSAAMDATSINLGNFYLTPSAAGSVTYNATSKVATFTPSASLLPAKAYTVTITTGAKDTAGVAMAENKVWSFTTAAAPVLTSHTPANGATDVSISDPNISATFSKEMNSATFASSFTVTKGGVAVAGSYYFNPPTGMLTFTPNSYLDPATAYTVTVTTGMKDYQDIALASGATWSFTTAGNTSFTSPGGPNIRKGKLLVNRDNPAKMSYLYITTDNKLYSKESSDKGFNWSAPLAIQETGTVVDMVADIDSAGTTVAVWISAANANAFGTNGTAMWSKKASGAAAWEAIPTYPAVNIYGPAGIMASPSVYRATPTDLLFSVGWDSGLNTSDYGQSVGLHWDGAAGMANYSDPPIPSATDNPWGQQVFGWKQSGVCVRALLFPDNNPTDPTAYNNWNGKLLVTTGSASSFTASQNYDSTYAIVDVTTGYPDQPYLVQTGGQYLLFYTVAENLRCKRMVSSNQLNGLWYSAESYPSVSAVKLTDYGSYRSRTLYAVSDDSRYVYLVWQDTNDVIWRITYDAMYTSSPFGLSRVADNLNLDGVSINYEDSSSVLYVSGHDASGGQTIRIPNP